MEPEWIDELKKIIEKINKSLPEGWETGGIQRFDGEMLEITIHKRLPEEAFSDPFKELREDISLMEGMVERHQKYHEETMEKMERLLGKE